MTGQVMVTLLGGIIGTTLAPDPAWATLPVALMIVGIASATVPAALLMKRIGRRAGFVFGAIAGAGGALLAAWAVYVGNFVVFCAAVFVVGANAAFGQQYRYAAAESVSPDHISKAVSWVLLGAIAAAWFGPEVAQYMRDFGGLGPYPATFLVLAATLLVAAALLSMLVEVEPAHISTEGEARPLSAVVRQPSWIVAVMAGMVSYGVMSFIMTATPVSMHVVDGYTLADTAWVIQSHVMAMYIPALVTGHLIARFGVVKVMSVGLACLTVCMVLALRSHELLHYWTALIALGVGWNFLFISGTTLLTETYNRAERFKTQALNDFLVFGTMAFGSLCSGAVIHWLGWERLIAFTFPPLILMAVGLVVLYRSRARH